MEDLSILLISTLFLPFYPLTLSAEEEQYNAFASHNTQTTFIDKTYHYLNTKFCQPAIWFDDLFVYETDNQDTLISKEGAITSSEDTLTSNEDDTASTLIRWQNDIYWHESEGLKYESQLKMRVNLPKVSRRLKLIFESEDDDEDPFLSTKKEEAPNQLGLRYDLYGERRSSFNVKVTLRPGIEARYRYSYPFTTQTSIHFIQKLYQKEKITGESSLLDLDHKISADLLLRWTNFAKFETDIDAFKFGTGLTLYQSISQKQSIKYKASISGPDKPYRYIANSHLSVTYRQNILRKWLFYEITPELNWDKTPDIARYREATITLRLEVLFKNI